MKDLSSLKSDCELSPLPLWSYFQIRSYTNNTTHKKDFIRQLTDLESVCVSDEHLKRATSVFYKWLQNSEHTKVDGLRESWSHELQMNITETQ